MKTCFLRSEGQKSKIKMLAGQCSLRKLSGRILPRLSQPLGLQERLGLQLLAFTTVSPFPHLTATPTSDTSGHPTSASSFPPLHLGMLLWGCFALGPFVHSCYDIFLLKQQYHIPSPAKRPKECWVVLRICRPLRGLFSTAWRTEPEHWCQPSGEVWEAVPALLPSQKLPGTTVQTAPSRKGMRRPRHPAARRVPTPRSPRWRAPPRPQPPRELLAERSDPLPPPARPHQPPAGASSASLA